MADRGEAAGDRRSHGVASVVVAVGLGLSLVGDGLADLLRPGR